MVGLCLADTLVHRAVFAGRSGGFNPLHKIANPPTKRPIMSMGG